MQTQLVVTADNYLIEELKTVIEGFISKHQNDEIMVETKIKKAVTFDDVRELKGILNQYHPKPLTDEEIENGIHQGIIQRAMIK
ncbi:hypothetical protein [Moraxella sp. Pampa]|uniref:hypothetical protein n=1 Tax=Moraxella sp. Pampa TaxID=3111978 RepID=UPI002B41290D|nr:hypothetical protein [Moraxella sp. Pampa]